nr:uncharacterized protein LOC112929570 [Vulpes vulpes]
MQGRGHGPASQPAQAGRQRTSPRRFQRGAPGCRAPSRPHSISGRSASPAPACSLPRPALGVGPRPLPHAPGPGRFRPASRRQVAPIPVRQGRSSGGVGTTALLPANQTGSARVGQPLALPLCNSARSELSVTEVSAPGGREQTNKPLDVIGHGIRPSSQSPAHGLARGRRGHLGRPSLRIFHGRGRAGPRPPRARPAGGRAGAVRARLRGGAPRPPSAPGPVGSGQPTGTSYVTWRDAASRPRDGGAALSARPSRCHRRFQNCRREPAEPAPRRSSGRRSSRGCSGPRRPDPPVPHAVPPPREQAGYASPRRGAFEVGRASPGDGGRGLGQPRAGPGASALPSRLRGVGAQRRGPIRTGRGTGAGTGAAGNPCLRPGHPGLCAGSSSPRLSLRSPPVGKPIPSSPQLPRTPVRPGASVAPVPPPTTALEAGDGGALGAARAETQLPPPGRPWGWDTGTRSATMPRRRRIPSSKEQEYLSQKLPGSMAQGPVTGGESLGVRPQLHQPRASGTRLP